MAVAKYAHSYFLISWTVCWFYFFDLFLLSKVINKIKSEAIECSVHENKSAKELSKYWRSMKPYVAVLPIPVNNTVFVDAIQLSQTKNNKIIDFYFFK